MVLLALAGCVTVRLPPPAAGHRLSVELTLGANVPGAIHRIAAAATKAAARHPLVSFRHTRGTFVPFGHLRPLAFPKAAYPRQYRKACAAAYRRGVDYVVAVQATFKTNRQVYCVRERFDLNPNNPDTCAETRTTPATQTRGTAVIRYIRVADCHQVWSAARRTVVAYGKPAKSMPRAKARLAAEVARALDQDLPVARKR